MGLINTIYLVAYIHFHKRYFISPEIEFYSNKVFHTIGNLLKCRSSARMRRGPMPWGDGIVDVQDLKGNIWSFTTEGAVAAFNPATADVAVSHGVIQ